MRNILPMFLAMLALAAMPTSAQSAARMPAGDVRIAAAEELEPVLPPILDVWQKQTTRKVVVTYASSTQLTQQIAHGGKFDLLLAGTMQSAQQLAGQGLVNRPVAFARGTLVLWARNDSPAQPLSVSGIAATLSSGKLRSVAIADPEVSAYGEAAEEFLAAKKLADAIKPKLAVSEDVAQATQLAESGKAQAAFLPLSSALTAKLRAEGSFVPVPSNTYSPLVMGAALVSASPHKQDAQRLMDFLTGPMGVVLLRVSGLSEPPKEKQ